MKKVDWYFDFISPYAYLQAVRLGEFSKLADVQIKPVLFAGLLGHHGNKGPAEIPSKRVHTYRQSVWLAQRNKVPFKLPASHPFNPLPMLRLFIALGGGAQLLNRMFSYVWGEGHLPTDTAPWEALMRELGVDDAEAEISRDEIKAALRANTEHAIAQGVFGVPSFVIDKQIYWGLDSTEMALGALRSDPLLNTAAMRAASHVADGVHRNLNK
jgi:2-hydroxychromene-2-carboxylate isomerase